MIIIIVGKNSKEKEEFLKRFKVDKTINYKQIDKVKATNPLVIDKNLDILIDGEFLYPEQINHISNIAKCNSIDYTVIYQWDMYTND